MTSITEFGSDGMSLPPTTFVYESENRSWSSSYEVWAPVDTPYLDWPNVTLSDVNRDGLVDIVTTHVDSDDNDMFWRIYMNTGSSWDMNYQDWLSGGGDAFPLMDLTYRVTIMDVTGDGLPDIVKTHDDTDDNDRIWRIWRNLGDRFNPTYEDWLYLNNNGDDPYLGDPSVTLSDVNGDGLPDIVDGDGYYFEIYLNNGSGWGPNEISWYAGSNHELREADTVLVDVNGDGLPDIVEGDIQWTVNLNNGGGWDSPRLWREQLNHHLDEYDTNLSDVNGDGLVDIVEGDGASGWDVNLNSGQGWDSPVSWLAVGPDFDSDVALADANGDGYPDVITREGGHGWLVYENRGRQSNLLTQVQNSLGGLVSVAYVPSTTFDNKGTDSISDLGFNVWVVQSITHDNGVAGEHHVIQSHTYTYEDGCHDYQDEEFRGFGKVVEVDAQGNSTTHFFHQDDARKGREERTEVRDASGNLYEKVENTYSSSIQGEGYLVHLSRTTRSVHDGNVSSPKATSVEYQYDQYGNITRKAMNGDNAQAGDERYEYTEYTYNPDLWIVNKAKLTYLRGSGDTINIRQTWFYYDHNAHVAAPPTRGNLTKQEDYLDTGDNPITLYQYDEYGNRTHVTNPNGHTTQYVYGITDPSHTFAEKKINAKFQETLYEYDVGTGHLLSETDPNGYTTTYVYDAFGRILMEIRPYDDATYPTIQYTYLRDGVAPEGEMVSQRTVSGESNTLDAYTLVDGFGRVIQTRKPAENPGQQIVVNTFYNTKGLPARQTVPHFTTAASGYTFPVTGAKFTQTNYDPLERLIQVQNPDGTSKT